MIKQEPHDRSVLFSIDWGLMCIEIVLDVVAIQTPLAFQLSDWMKPTTLWAQNILKIILCLIAVPKIAEEMKPGIIAELLSFWFSIPVV